MTCTEFVFIGKESINVKQEELRVGRRAISPTITSPLYLPKTQVAQRRACVELNDNTQRSFVGGSLSKGRAKSTGQSTAQSPSIAQLYGVPAETIKLLPKILPAHKRVIRENGKQQLQLIL